MKLLIMWWNKLTLCIASFPLGDHSREAHTLESIQGLNFRLAIETTKLFAQIYFRLRIKIDKKILIYTYSLRYTHFVSLKKRVMQNSH